MKLETTFIIKYKCVTYLIIDWPVILTYSIVEYFFFDIFSTLKYLVLITLVCIIFYLDDTLE